MINEYIWTLSWGLLFILTALFIAPLLDGLRRVVRAKVQRRIGPSILQTIYDLEKLFRTQPVLPYRNRFFTSIPFIVFALALLLAAAAPVPFIGGLSSLFDALTFIYVLLLVTVFIVLAGLMVPNIYSNIGSARELVLLTVFEVFVGFTLVGLAYKAGTLNLYDLAVRLGEPSYYLKPSTIFLSLSLFILAYVEGGYVPFDVAEAETEVLGGAVLEYSGRYYGLLYYALLVKRYVLLSLPVSLVFVSPLAIMVREYLAGLLVPLACYVLYVVFLFIVMTIYAVIEALNPRYRVDLVYRPLLLSSLIPLIGFVLGWFGW